MAFKLLQHQSSLAQTRSCVTGTLGATTNIAYSECTNSCLISAPALKTATLCRPPLNPQAAALEAAKRALAARQVGSLYPTLNPPSTPVCPSLPQSTLVYSTCLISNAPSHQYIHCPNISSTQTLDIGCSSIFILSAHCLLQFVSRPATLQAFTAGSRKSCCDMHHVLRMLGTFCACMTQSALTVEVFRLNPDLLECVGRLP